jgi:hypothetical protein
METTPPPEDEGSSLDRAILAAGLEVDAIQNSLPLGLCDDPPLKCLLISDNLFCPSETYISEDTPLFPFSTETTLSFAESELIGWQLDLAQHLVRVYELQEAQLLASLNTFKDPPSTQTTRAQRAHFFADYVISLVDAPERIAVDHLHRLAHLRKLWLNREFAPADEDGIESEVCCKIQDCSHIAILGSEFCGWHILEDSEQWLFVKCLECGAPRVQGSAVPCICDKDLKGRMAQRRQNDEPELAGDPQSDIPAED